jgi:hypothetical protein
MRFGGGPAPRSGWGVPNQFWATSAATRSIPLGVAGTALAPGARLADGYAERAGRWWTRSDPQNVDPVTGRSLRERWEIWDRLTLRTDLVLAERSTIDAGARRAPNHAPALGQAACPPAGWVSSDAGQRSR